ncbi:serum paraoxonase/arylesterase family protein [Aspergillus alliaceus]|uniref:Serum paraoxonase/arylesterase family protein n=1 Tax=Petromyces alliaceus TaxID=209559 RepID=A0A5N7CNQ0_PETAA|nr:serum paraoxonase/arylesterase family protein [Aspergillus alliaceus]
MGSLLNLAILTVLVATFYGPVHRQMTVLGVLRKATDEARLAEQQAFYKIEDTMHCEDLHFHRPSHKIFTACEDSVLPRFKWFPPLGNFEGPVSSTGSIHVIDPKTMRSTRLVFENFSGPLITHGIEVLEDPDNPGAVYIFVVNHMPNMEYYQGDSRAQDVPKARSQVELFHHALGSNTVRHVRSILHSLIVTPNDIYAESPLSFYVTNDHFYREGFKRQVEDLVPAAKWSNVVHVQVDSLESEQAEIGVNAKVALVGLQNNNGLGHGQSKEEILISNAIGGIMYRGRANPEPRNISILDEVHFDSSIDNPSYYMDPYRTSSGDASGYVLAGLLRPIDLAKNHADPNGKDGVMVWYARPNTPKEGSAVEWQTRLIFEDDGSNIRSSSTALLVPIELQPGEKKKAWLFVTGFVSENVIAVEVFL